MQIKNGTSFPVIASCSFVSLGEGEKRLIQPGVSAQVLGPPIAKIEGRICYAVETGEITSHDNPNNQDRFFVAKGHPSIIDKIKVRIIIRHHLDVESCPNKQSLWNGDEK